MFGIYEEHAILDRIGTRKSRHAMRNTLRGYFTEVDESAMTLLLGRINAYRIMTSMTPIAKNYPEIYRHTNESLYGPLQVIYVMEISTYLHVVIVRQHVLSRQFAVLYDPEFSW